MTTPPEPSAKPLSDLEAAFGALSPDRAAQLLAATGELTLVLNGEGVVTDAALSSDALGALDVAAWVGRLWSDTVTIESRPKVEELLRDALSEIPARPRHVNHPTASGDAPIAYTALALAAGGPIVATGRDLAPLAALQARLTRAQEAFAQDLDRTREAEARQRMLFQLSDEAMVLVAEDSRRIVEVNAAAERLLGARGAELIDRRSVDAFALAENRRLERLFAEAREAERTPPIEMTISGGRAAVMASAEICRQGGAWFILLRLAPTGPQQDVARFRDLVGRAPLEAILTETRDVVERLCLETALAARGGDAAAAAEALGLSRAALDEKLRRYGLGVRDVEP